MPTAFDYIIVGGGSAGCVLANRLSARASSSVLLLEAGRDTAPGNEPADVADTYPVSYYNRSYSWPDLTGHMRRRDTSPDQPVNQARILGGGSSLMGMAHHAGTCRMGADDDPMAVVDKNARVRGVAGLRVVDASIMPAIPRGNTNIPTIMVAEKIAAAIVKGH